VIAAVEGAAIGAGCVVALVCDILLVAEEAFMSMTEVDYGLAGGVRHILRSFSPSDARLMIYTARRISGPELYRMNVASRCVPRDQLKAEAWSLAAEIASKVPLAVVAAKRSFGLTEEMPLRDGYRYEQTQTAALADTEDTREALAAFREKRKPVFKGR
jgi:enoyl-CoA hydratase